MPVLGRTIDPRLSPELGRDLIEALRRDRPDGGRRASQRLRPRSRPVLAESLRRDADSPAEILILGATGFIGQELARQLLGRWTSDSSPGAATPARLPKDLQSPGVEIIRGDLTRRSTSKRRLPAAGWSTTWPGQMSKPGTNSPSKISRSPGTLPRHASALESSA